MKINFHKWNFVSQQNNDEEKTFILGNFIILLYYCFLIVVIFFMAHESLLELITIGVTTSLNDSTTKPDDLRHFYKINKNTDQIKWTHIHYCKQ